MNKGWFSYIKKNLSFSFAFIMVLLMSVSAFGAGQNKSDLTGHWAENYILSLSSRGIMSGFNNRYEPDRAITRAEFANMAVTAFQFNKPSTIKFNDVPDGAWYADSISKAAGQGFMQGYQGKAKPLDTLTREDAAVMFSKILKSQSGLPLNMTDAQNISDYARDSVAALYSSGYLNGDENGNFNPKKNLTRGEAAKLLYVIAGNIYKDSREFDLHDVPITGNATIAASGVTLKNTVIQGNLYITEGVGTGEVTLENVEVKGETLVSGGGMNSIVFVNTKTGVVKVEVPDGIPVRIVASGNSTIDFVATKSEAKFQESGLTGSGFKDIVIYVPENSKVSLDGNFDSVIMESPNSKLDILGGTIGNINVSDNAANSEINIASTAKVDNLNCYAKSTVGGTGKINNATISANGVNIYQKPDTVNVDDGISANVNNEKVDDSSTSNSNKNDSSSGSGSGGSSSGDDDSSSSRKKLYYSYIELEYRTSSTFIRMIFNEPISISANGTQVIDKNLKEVFAYSDGTNVDKISSVILSDDGKSIEFLIPRVIINGKHNIVLADSFKNKGCEIKGKTSGRKLPNINESVLSFETSPLNNSNFAINGIADIQVTAGELASFEAQVSESVGDLKYQWYKDGNAIVGATDSSYSFYAGLNDNSVKIHVVVSQITQGSNIRVVKNSDVAFISVKSSQSKTVFLEPGSLGVAGDSCITGLTKEYRYFIRTGNKVYPLKADGTLGLLGTEIKYENLEPLNTTVITNLVNENFYYVGKVTPDSPMLNSMTIMGGTETISFTSYVSPAVSLKANPSQSNLQLSLASDNENALVKIYTKITPDSEYKLIYDGEKPNSKKFTIGLNRERMTECIQIELYNSEELDSKMLYYIEVTKNSDMIVAPLGYFYNAPNVLVSDDLKEIKYRILYKESSVDFKGIEYDSKPLVEGIDYTKEIDVNGNIITTINKEVIDKLPKVESGSKVFTFNYLFSNDVTKAAELEIRCPVPPVEPEIIINPTSIWIDSMSLHDIQYTIMNKKESVLFKGIKYNSKDLNEGTDFTQTKGSSGNIVTIIKKEFLEGIIGEISEEKHITFYYLFENEKGISITKMAKLIVTYVPPAPTTNITVGTPEFINTDPNKYIEIYLPLFLDGKPVEYNDIKKRISQASILFLKDEVEATYSMGMDMSNVGETDGIILQGKKGICLSLESIKSEFARVFDPAYMPNKYNLYLQVNNIEGYKSLTTSGDIATAKVISSNFNFDKAELSPKFSSSNYKYELKVNTGFTTSFLVEEGANREFYLAVDMSQKAYVSDEDGNRIEVYKGSKEDPEIFYYIANKNTAPRLYTFNLGGEAYVDGSFIIEHYGVLNNYSNMTNIDFCSYTGYDYAINVSELLSKKMDLDNTIYSLATDENGNPINISLKSMIDNGNLKEGSTDNNTMKMSFENTVNLIKGFNINPVKDTINEVIKVTPKLTGSMKYKPIPTEVALSQSGGALTNLIIKDKNSELQQEISISDGTREYDVSIPYSEAAFRVSSTGSYEAILYDKDGIPLDSKGLILTPGVPQKIAIVIGKGNTVPKVYKFTLTYEPTSSKLRSAISDEAMIYFEYYSDEDFPIFMENTEQTKEVIEEGREEIPEDSIVIGAPVENGDLESTEETLKPEEIIKPEEITKPEEEVKPEETIKPDEATKPEEEVKPEDKIEDDKEIYQSEIIIRDINSRDNNIFKLKKDKLKFNIDIPYEDTILLFEDDVDISYEIYDEDGNEISDDEIEVYVDEFTKIKVVISKYNKNEGIEVSTYTLRLTYQPSEYVEDENDNDRDIWANVSFGRDNRKTIRKLDKGL